VRRVEVGHASTLSKYLLNRTRLGTRLSVELEPWGFLSFLFFVLVRYRIRETCLFRRLLS